MPSQTQFLISLFGSAAEPLREVLLTVVRAGRLIGGTDHLIERDYYPGHEFILCRSGKGWVRTGGKLHKVLPGQLLWVNCHHPHRYGADKLAPWSVDWIRIEGSPLDRIWKMLSVDAVPVFPVIDAEAIAIQMEKIFDLMQSESRTSPAWIGVCASTILAHCYDARDAKPPSALELLPPAVERVIQQMRLYYHKPLRISDLAATAGMSPSHFNRVFRSAVGSSPIDWLRHYRINQAKRRLLESTDSVKEVARQVGYSDQFYFSKDFKRFTALSPSLYRDVEAGRTSKG